MTQEVHEIALSYMETLDCPRSLTVAILLRYGEWSQVLALKAVPHQYCAADHYFRSVCATDFLRKLSDDVGVSTPLARRELTLEKWWAAEKECFRTNQMILRLNAGLPNSGTFDSALLSFLEEVRKNVRSLIGSAPPVSYQGKFGPGATVSDTHGRYNVPFKLCSRLTLTSPAIYHLVPFTGTAWGRLHAGSGEWSFGSPLVVRGNKFFTVPKTALIDRPCAKEPSLNAFYQLGLGKILRARLRSHGIDLENGQQIHRDIACKASRDDSFATIDLSSASDCIARRLVDWVMPRAWADELNALRSPFTEVDGKQVLLEKFSSMGNGFTFELETVLFAAICMAVSPEIIPGHTLYVYGDDIIVPTVHAKKVIAALEILGFTTNKDKTFVAGPFRESCGGDFFDGVPVRAHYLKEFPCEPQDYIALANGLRRVLCQVSGVSWLHASVARPWYQCIRCLPTRLRGLRGPSALGDVVLHDDDSAWVVRWKDSIRYIKAYVRGSSPGIPLTRWHSDVVLASVLYGDRPSVENFGGKEIRTIIPRDWGYSYSTKWIPYS